MEIFVEKETSLANYKFIHEHFEKQRKLFSGKLQQ